MSSSPLFPVLPQNLPTIHTSVMLRRLIDHAPQDHFSLDWVMNNMPQRSYGVLILLLASLSLVPFIGILTRLLIMFFAVQIMVGYRHPVFPQRMMLKKMPSRYLTELPPIIFRTLRYLEKSIRPRWGIYLGMRWLSACILFFVSLFSLIVPFPFANIPCAVISALMALAYIEHDGLLLVLAQAMGITFIWSISLIFLGAAWSGFA